MSDISILGIFVADLCFLSNSIPIRGQTVLGTSHVIGPGGKGSNQAVAGALDLRPARILHRQVPLALLYEQRPYVGGNR